MAVAVPDLSDDEDLAVGLAVPDDSDDDLLEPVAESTKKKRLILAYEEAAEYSSIPAHD